MTLPVARPRRAVDDALVVALASGMTYDDGAKSAGCSPRTVDRRMTDPAFRRRVQEARAAACRRTADLLLDAAVEAVGELRVLMRSADSDAARVSAARPFSRSHRPGATPSRSSPASPSSPSASTSSRPTRSPAPRGAAADDQRPPPAARPARTELHPRQTSDEVSAELARALSEIAVLTADALDRDDRAQAQAYLCFAQETKDLFDSYAPWPGDWADFLAEHHPDVPRQSALATEFRAAVPAQARPSSDRQD